MTEISKELKEYFDILSPRDRRLCFEEITGLDDDTMEFCRRLYRDRYDDPKDPDHRVDAWLWKVVYLPGLFKRRKMLKGAVKNEITGVLKDLHLEDPELLTELERTILYHEFRNVAKRYLSTCSGVNYGSRMFGLKKANADEKRKKACEDIWMASRGFAIASKNEDKLRIWCDAFRDEYYEYDRGGKAHYEELEKKYTSE